ncbi:Pectin acetylesterase 3 [Durusdinium trenchii]|uniref:Pectin acetylesterase 3 n=1 Tax=Durusdinium trenchii TaxID=1381693 RepID=A0ABP0RDE3_9DINO
MQFTWRKGTLAARDPELDEWCLRAIVQQQVPREHVARRVERDGAQDAFHVTVLLPQEAKRALATFNKDTLVAMASEAALGEARPLKLGIGRAGKGAVVFAVLEWPAMQDFRRRLGLPRKALHLTLGFAQADLHDVDKSLDSIVFDGRSFSRADAEDVLERINTVPDPTMRDAILGVVLHHTRAMRDPAASNVVAARALVCRAKLAATQIGDLDRAVTDLLVSLELVDSPRVRMLLGDAFRKQGHRVDARDQYRRALATPQVAETPKVRELLLARLVAIESREQVPPPQKFPRTRHLINLGAATRDDLLFPAGDFGKFCDDSQGLVVSVEEKLDGANLGIFVDNDWQLVCKNRGHSVSADTATQWTGLDRWTEEHKTELYALLQQRYVIYGEWMFAKHSIHYARLPSLFMVFDLFDRVMCKFVSVTTRDALLAAYAPSLCVVPAVKRRAHFSLDTLQDDVRALLQETRSVFYDGPVEGLVLRCDEVDLPDGMSSFQVTRAKVVRSDFTQSIDEHWTRADLVRNKVDKLLFEQLQGGRAASSSKKYPSTPHLPFSPCVQSDDIVSGLDSASLLADGHTRVIVTEKLDGGNCCLKGGKVYARTHSKEASHWSFGEIKALYSSWIVQVPEIADLELFGENMSAVHSIEYDNLNSPFYLFAVRDPAASDRDGQAWLAWDDMQALADRLDIPTVPVVFDGVFRSLLQVQQLMQGQAQRNSRVSTELPGEGYVIRVARAFGDDAFEASIAKYVRANHVQTSADWKATATRASIKPPPPPGTRVQEQPRVQLFVDLDGVLADFERGVRELTGKTPEQLGVSHMWRSVEQANGFFSRLSWMPGAQEMWHTHLRPLRPTILSGVPMSTTRWAEKQKLEWCKRHLGHEVPVILCATRDKALYSGPGRILIDDRERTRRPWEAAGGAFVLYKHAAGAVAELTRQVALQGTQPELQEAAQGSAKQHKHNKSDNKRGGKQTRAKLAKSKFKLVVLAGLPGSGKSSIGEFLEQNLFGAVRVSQDEVGSRKVCEDLVGRASKTANVVILDRCNVESAERKHWVALAMTQPKHTLVVHVATDLETCVTRIVQRQGHPTVATNNPDAARRIVAGFHAKWQNPDAGTEGFGALKVVDPALPLHQAQQSLLSFIAKP